MIICSNKGTELIWKIMVASFQPITVTALKENECGRVLRFNDDQLAGKLLSMGILPGSLLKVKRIAPLSGGYVLKIDGHSLALRLQEAESIVVE